MSLLQTLQRRINQNPELSFMEYMHLALYAPGEGYYSSGLQKIGTEGDFITAPELTPLFGRTLANQCHQILSQLEAPHLLEYGAGTGKLCIDILKRLNELQCLPESYMIMEVSSNLKQRQKELISQEIPQLAHRVQWLDSWPKQAFNGIILANEVLDAMPVHRFMLVNDNLLESYISMDEHNKLIEQFKPCTNQRLINYIRQHIHIDSSPYLSEANLQIDDWILNNYRILKQGVMLLIDYGFPRHEYYHPDRKHGTLMCHYQHHSHSDPFTHPGEQDITAHVDFTHVAEAGHHAGFHIAGYTNQASFLLSNGLLSLIHSIEGQQEQMKAKQAIKQLTHPSEMGELFKVIALSKQMEIELHGFQLQDKRVNL